LGAASLQLDCKPADRGGDYVPVAGDLVEIDARFLGEPLGLLVGPVGAACLKTRSPRDRGIFSGSLIEYGDPDRSSNRSGAGISALRARRMPRICANLCARGH